MQVHEIFNQFAQDYDRSRRQLVPSFDDFYGAVTHEIPFPAAETIRVLDLGAGTGLLSMLVARRFPQARITLVDLAPRMLALARERFAGQTRFRFIEADFQKGLAQGPYEAIVSSLAIHHLADDAKASLYQAAYMALTPGGVFINADQVLGHTPEIEARYEQAWREQALAEGCTQADLEAAIERKKVDRNATLAANLEWLERAGFSGVDCWYHNYRVAVFGGRR